MFNIDTLPSDLSQAGIGYLHMRSLGGRRPKQSGIEASVNALWHVQAFHNYADYALGEEFAGAFAQLVQLGHGSRIAVMCSEAVWWRCHRRIIVDYLLANGESAEHILNPGQPVPATLTPGAVITMNDKVVYPSSDERKV